MVFKETGFFDLQSRGVLTDGQYTCPYSDILEIFGQIQALFVEREIGTKDCLALECDNSVPHVLVLLYLLEKGHRFLLLPKGGQNQSTLIPALLPRFCRYQILVESQNQGDKTASLGSLDRQVAIVPNEQWLPDCIAAERLYLRTSGSTGVPKIAVHSRARLWKNVLNCVLRFGLSHEDRVVIPVPIYHMYGLGAALLPSVAVGASIDLQKGANLLRYLQREREFNPNVAFLTPAFCETLLKARKSPRSYKFTVAAGDRLREDTFVRYEEKFGCLVKLYGSTELGAIAAGNPDEAIEARLQQVGLPMPGVQVRVELSLTASLESNFSTHQPDLSKGASENAGELWCYHPAGFEGYVDLEGQPIQSHPDLQADWFRTKDLAELRADGRLTVLGRCDRSINRDGLLVPFSQVEQAIETLAGVAEVIVESQGESQRGKGLVVYCVLTMGTAFSEAELRAACFELLPKHAIPDRVFILEALPLLPNGKVDRQTLIGMNVADVMDLATR